MIIYDSLDFDPNHSQYTKMGNLVNTDVCCKIAQIFTHTINVQRGVGLFEEVYLRQNTNFFEVFFYYDTAELSL